VLVPLAAPHLADAELHVAARQAIRTVACDAIGTLTDLLLDTDIAFAVRRRIAPLLAECRTQRAADGLIAALSDARLEVRYVAGRALLTMTEGTDHGIVIGEDLVIKLVQEELARAEEEDTVADLDARDDDNPQASLFDAIARVRVSRRLEHIFDILALTMDREPLRLAFRCIDHPNERHRGTALEYIQSVLPPEVRSPLWPLLSPDHALLPAPREAGEVLGELARLLDEPRTARP
jgi:HEAT repeat protein